MATKSLIAPEEYFRTSFEGPEPDYVDGELIERTMPNSLHARTQIRLADAFKPWEDRSELFRLSEIRFPVAPDRFRVADFAVFPSEQRELIPEDLPRAVIEIVSPDDRHEELMLKLADYEAAGVAYVFIADPPMRKLSRYLRGDLLTVTSLDLPEYGVSLPSVTIFP